MVFHFRWKKETLCPITLFEYGGALERNQKLFAGCHREYQREKDLTIQTRLSRFSYMTVHKSIYDLMDEIMFYYIDVLN